MAYCPCVVHDNSICKLRGPWVLVMPCRIAYLRSYTVTTASQSNYAEATIAVGSRYSNYGGIPLEYLKMYYTDTSTYRSHRVVPKMNHPSGLLTGRLILEELLAS